MTTISNLKKLDLLTRKDGEVLKITNITAKSVMYTFDLVTKLGQRTENGSTMDIYKESILNFQNHLNSGYFKLN